MYVKVKSSTFSSFLSLLSAFFASILHYERMKLSGERFPKSEPNAHQTSKILQYKLQEDALLIHI